MCHFRFYVSLLGCTSVIIIYGLKVNLSIAVVSMVNHTHMRLYGPKVENSSRARAKCEELKVKDEVLEDGPFKWTSMEQGIVLGSYFWGYMFSQIPGGRLSEVTSAKWTLFAAVAINVLGTLVTPVCAKWHYLALCVVRVIEGLGAGASFPALHVLQSVWVPNPEKSFVNAVVYMGSSLGTVFSTLSGGIIASKLGWEAVFYIMGCSSAIWLLLWLFISDSPVTQRCISDKERDYILSSTTKPGKKPKFPCKAVMKSMPFWAIFITNVTNDFGWYMLLIELPIYMKQVLHYKLKGNAVVSSMPYLSQWAFTIIMSKVLDVARQRNWISLTTSRKIATAIGSFFMGICLLALCYIGCNILVATILIFVAITGAGAFWVGFFCNHIDIAPNFAGTLVGMTNTLGNLWAIIIPAVLGKIMDSTTDVLIPWQIMFWITTACVCGQTLIYCIYGSAVEQPWNKVGEENSDDKLTA